jgi:hypothetical protein
MKILLKIVDKFYEKNELVMDFWNDDTMFITHKKEKCGLKKNHINIKIIIKKATIKWII